MTKRQDRPCCLPLLTACLTVGGCSSLPPGPAYLQNGEASGLPAVGAALRNQLQPVAAHGVALRYKTGSCEYSFHQEGSTVDKRVKLTSESLPGDPRTGDRLLIHVTGLWEESTILIDRTGKIYSMNIHDGGGRVTDQDFDTVARKRLGLLVLLGGHYVSPTATVLPHFLGVPRGPGARVAEVPREDGKVWGAYIYRGMVTYKGLQTELFDLVRDEDRSVRGFMLFETRNMVPILIYFVMGGQSVRFDEVECTETYAGAS